MTAPPFALLNNGIVLAFHELVSLDPALDPVAEIPAHFQKFVQVPGIEGEEAKDPTGSLRRWCCLGQVLFQPVNVVGTVGDVGVADEVDEQGDGRLDAVDDELGQCPL